MKRYVLYGSYPYSGGWNDYVFQFDTKREALSVAIGQLKLGCSAYLEDKEAKTQTEITLRNGEQDNK